MSHPSRPKTGQAARRTRPALKPEPVVPLEDRKLPAPVISEFATTATFTASTPQSNTNLGSVTITQGAALATSASAYVSVAQLTPLSEFGGDIVRIEAGPGGDFGKGVYAISRGAGSNTGAANRPGTVFRVDPATGKASLFFDLNTVLASIEPGGTAANSNGAASGMVNWYDMAFDPEGYFDGKPSLFISSVDRTDPNKNVIFRVAPDGSFLGMFIKFTASNGGQFTRTPSAVSVPPPEQQTFLRGLISGDGAADGGFVALFFNANEFAPGTDLNSVAVLPPGVTRTGMTFGPQTGIIASNSDYISNQYATFTDFGTPGAGGIPAQPGLSGVQGILGDLLIGNGGTGTTGSIITSFTDPNFTTVDAAAAIITPFRRFEDIAFDQYGYFSYGTTVTPATGGGRVTVGTPTYAGSLFVSDLATGLSVQVTPLAPLPTTPVNVPIQGPGGPIGVSLDGAGNVVPIVTNGNTTGGSNIGGRIIRIDPNGNVTPFAEGFNTSGRQDSKSFIDSSLSITFSADGTTFYASDNDGIWQFKSVMSLAGSTSGSLVGLNDLRSLGAPYEGQDSAAAIIDTGVDALSPPLRGRVAEGRNVLTNGAGNDDLAAVGGTGTAATTAGHGTPVAGVVAQFVPQITIQPVNVFTPFQVPPTAGATGTTIATAQSFYSGLEFVSQNPFVKDPVRPNALARTVVATLGFGTQRSFVTEGSAYKQYPQIVVALKNQMRKLRQLGIQPIAAAGQFGNPNRGTTTTATVGDVNGMALPAVLNEVVSVTGTIPFPYTGTATSGPNDPGTGIVPRPPGPILVVGNNVAGTGADVLGPAGTIAASDLLLYKDKILSTVNRSSTTDFAAPAIDVPTFMETNTTNGTTHNVFTLGGTSLSAGIVAGSFATVASALDYWTNIAKTGFTADAYLNQPVGTTVLNYGARTLLDLTAYNNPDGINSILQWTAVPATDQPNTLDTAVLPKQLFGSPDYKQYSRIDVGNAIAAIETSIALNYLIQNRTFDVIDANQNGLITAQEIQTFVDQSNTIGMPEAGAMARLLGGTARIPTTGFQSTAAGENPDQPDVLQRRYNFLDYAVDGQLNGVISLDQIQLLAKNTMPSPDAFVVVDRQRASANGYLIEPGHFRNYVDLQRIKPTFAWVPKAAVARFRGISPGRFGVGRGLFPGVSSPSFTLFEPRKATTKATGGSGTTGNGRTGGQNNGGQTGGGQTGGGQNNGGTGGGGTNETPTNGSTQTDYQNNLLNAVKGLAGQSGTTGGTTTSNGTSLGTAAPIESSSSTSKSGAPAAKSEGSGGTVVALRGQVVQDGSGSGSDSSTKKVLGPAKKKDTNPFSYVAKLFNWK